MEAKHSKRTQIGPITIRIETGDVVKYLGTGKGFAAQTGWMLTVQLGKGMGYRWVDLPGYSHNKAHKLRGRLYIAGRTLRVGWRCRTIGGPAAPKRKHLFKAQYRTSAGNAGSHIVPGWWN